MPAFGDESFEGLFMNSQEVKEETLNNIDGMGLAKNPHDKVTAKHKKKWISTWAFNNRLFIVYSFSFLILKAQINYTFKF